MSAAHQRLQIARLCGKEETSRDAKELMSLARSKTGPGSGHDLGKNAIALPAICALLASERLGTNDVVKKVAQEASCLKAQDFEAALSTVRGALSGYLSRRQGSNVSYKSLCRSHGLDEDALYWMEEVDKQLRKSGEVEDLDADEEAVLCMVFYWTCIALNIRSVKQATIIQGYGVPLHAFQDLEENLDSTCGELKERMGEFAIKARTARSAISTPNNALGKKHTGRVSPTPSYTPTKSPTKTMRSREMSDGSPSKRKAVLPPLPFISAGKKQKTMSPVKLNRLPTTGTQSTPSKSSVSQSILKASPTKSYGKTRSFLDPRAQSTSPALISKPKLVQVDAEIGPENRTEAENPVTPIKNRASQREAVEKSTLSTPRYSERPQTSTAAPSTPIRRNARPHLGRKADGDIEMEDISAELVDHTACEASESSSDDEAQHPPCRHYVPVFADKLFYHYRDPRILREWEACERHLKDLQLGRAGLANKLPMH